MPRLLRISTAGSIDDGKSTLIGRLLYETGSVPADQLAEARRATRSASIEEAGEEIDFALLCDGLEAEREQGITIDVAYRFFSTSRRAFIIADTPGHEQYTRNMATGLSTANLALVLVDARKGLSLQSKRHAFIASLLGVKHLLVCVNKMDLVGYRQEAFEEVCEAFLAFSARLEVPDLRFLPLSALKGDNVARVSEAMPWYSGGPLLRLLETIHCGADRNMIDLRFPVQLVLRPHQEFRGYAGQVASGIVRPGAAVMVLPSRRTTRVKRIVTLTGELAEAYAPMSIALELEDELDVIRGDVIVHPHNQPRVGRHLEAMVVWMSDGPLREGARLLVKHTTRTVGARVERVRYEIDVRTLSRKLNRQLPLNGIGRVVLQADEPLYYDTYRVNRATGSLVFMDPETNATVGAGTLIEQVPTVSATEQAPREIGRVAREERLGQRGITLWFTGLCGSGKSTLARALERRLFEAGRHVLVLDGDAVRAGLSSDLGFSPEDRGENLRRVGHAARILNDAGQIVLAAFVSPARAAREAVRETIGAERFLLVHVATPLDVCRERDPKGLYARAAAGELQGLTGVDAPYEEPEAPDARLTGEEDLEAAVDHLVRLLEPHLRP